MTRKEPITKDELEKKLKGKMSYQELNKVFGAFEMAENAYQGQNFKNGESCFDHISSVCRILFDELEINDPDILIAGLLHDIYDTNENITRETIEFNFGAYVSTLLDAMNDQNEHGITKLESIEKKIKIPGDDFLIIRLAENLDRFRNLDFHPKYDPISSIKATSDYYFPIVEKSQNEHLKYLLNELKKERNKILG